MQTFFVIRQRTFRDGPVRAGIKSENLFRPTCVSIARRHAVAQAADTRTVGAGITHWCHVQLRRRRRRRRLMRPPRRSPLQCQRRARLGSPLRLRSRDRRHRRRRPVRCPRACCRCRRCQTEPPCWRRHSCRGATTRRTAAPTAGPACARCPCPPSTRPTLRQQSSGCVYVGPALTWPSVCSRVVRTRCGTTAWARSQCRACRRRRRRRWAPMAPAQGMARARRRVSTAGAARTHTPA
jgi:hypothetical protein